VAPVTVVAVASIVVVLAAERRGESHGELLRVISDFWCRSLADINDISSALHVSTM
jgi:hypothetical protein